MIFLNFYSKLQLQYTLEMCDISHHANRNMQIEYIHMGIRDTYNNQTKQHELMCILRYKYVTHKEECKIKLKLDIVSIFNAVSLVKHFWKIGTHFTLDTDIDIYNKKCAETLQYLSVYLNESRENNSNFKIDEFRMYANAVNDQIIRNVKNLFFMCDKLYFQELIYPEDFRELSECNIGNAELEIEHVSTSGEQHGRHYYTCKEIDADLFCKHLSTFTTVTINEAGHLNWGDGWRKFMETFKKYFTIYNYAEGTTITLKKLITEEEIMVKPAMQAHG